MPQLFLAGFLAVFLVVFFVLAMASVSDLESIPRDMREMEAETTKAAAARQYLSINKSISAWPVWLVY